VYEILLGDTVIHSKKDTGAFPDPEEIKQRVSAS
jgi:predicted Rdx family selenoprotein